MSNNPNPQQKRIDRAKVQLVLKQPWFGSLLLRLKVEQNDNIPTMATDGTHLYWNEAFTATLSDEEIKGVLAHEVMHCAMQHMYRKGNRHQMKFNVAADYAINPLLLASGFKLPKGCLDDPQYHGLTAEQIYARLPAVKTIKISMPDLLEPSDSKQGDKSEAGMTAADWQIAVEQATQVAQREGRLPAGIQRSIQPNKPLADWRAILRRFVDNTIAHDYSWTNPNRRFVAQGTYLPGMVKENAPRMVVGVDTSGSIGVEELNIFASELTAILHEVRPLSLDVIYCDADVAGKQSFSPDDGEVKLEPKGGGGTEFQPVFDEVEKDGEPPACLIYFTDLYGPAPQEPEYPVLWVTTEKSSVEGFFGETVRLSRWE
jgi:predicted metal-dependent peptidase